jgi:hypothetical protein
MADRKHRHAVEAYELESWEQFEQGTKTYDAVCVDRTCRAPLRVVVTVEEAAEVRNPPAEQPSQLPGASGGKDVPEGGGER